MMTGHRGVGSGLEPLVSATPSAVGPSGEAARWSQPREREAVRQAIVEAASKLASAQGEAAVTLATVAAELGFARPVLYAHFAS